MTVVQREVEKRVFDVVVAVLALTLLAPVLLAGAALVWLEDRGPVFFRQPSIGKDGTKFSCYKFRSMLVNAHDIEARMRPPSGHLGPLWKLERTRGSPASACSSAATPSTSCRSC